VNDHADLIAWLREEAHWYGAIKDYATTSAAFDFHVERSMQFQGAADALENLVTERDQLQETLECLRDEQPKALRIIEENGFSFDSIGKEPGNWQHLAFTLYLQLCEIDAKIHGALDLPIGAASGSNKA
jgi:hypothetical protein